MLYHIGLITTRLSMNIYGPAYQLISTSGMRDLISGDIQEPNKIHEIRSLGLLSTLFPKFKIPISPWSADWIRIRVITT